MSESSAKPEAADEPQASLEEELEEAEASTESGSSESGAETDSANEGDVEVVEDEEYVPPDEDAYKMLVEKAAKADLYVNELLRVKADLDNYQKRVRRERPGWEASAVRGFVRDLLPVVDNFERALETTAKDDTPIGGGPEGGAPEGGAPEGGGLLEGVRMICQMLEKTLDDHGVVEIDALGKTFDPEVHEAVCEVPSPDHETGEVIEVQQRGYMHRDMVVRPSLVFVAKKVDSGSDHDES